MKIKSFLLKAFELKSEEYGKFLLLFFHSFFLGLFIAFYFVPANSVFIKHYGSEQLPIAYIFAGIAGYLSTIIYSSLQKRVSSRALFLGAVLFMFLVTILSRIALEFIDEVQFINEKVLSFFIFVWAWPFISLVGIESGGLALRLLNLRQVKRMFGQINMGGVMASILGYLAIPLIMPLLSHEYDLLYIAVCGTAISIILLFIIYKRFPEKVTQRFSDQVVKSTTTFRSLFKERYFALIFLSATLSMTVIYFADFGFLSSIKVQAKNGSYITPEQVPQFIAIVFGILKIGELVTSFFSSRILSKYGVKLGLTILPITSTLLITIAVIVGLLWGAISFIFFILFVLNKSLERILRRSLDDPSFNILYQPLPDEKKLSIQTKVGVIMQISIGIAGMLLLLVNEVLESMDGFKFFPLLFLPILLAWSFVALKLYNSYKERIRKILKEKNRKKDKDTDIYGTDVLSKQLRDTNEKVVENSVILLSETNPRALELRGVELLKRGNENVTKAILRIIDPTYRQEFKPIIQKICDTSDAKVIKELAEQALINLDYAEISSTKQHELQKLADSNKLEDKISLIKYLFLNKTEKDEDIIAKLLDDKNKMVKRAAIKLAGKRDSDKLMKTLVGFLRDPEYSHFVASTILEYGEKVLDELEILFKKETSIPVLLKIVEIYAKIGSQSAKALLVNHLSYQNKEIQLAVIRALYYCQYQVNVKERTIIKQKVEDIVEYILWTFVAINDIETEKNTLKVIQSIDLERKENFDILFYLLSFIYQPATIDLIKTNIIGENTIFALEIIENFITQDIKLLIIPLFDKISVSQRMKKLHSYFPHKKMKFTDRLKDIITRDYNKVDVWTIAKTMELLGKLHRRKKSNEVRADETEYQNQIDVWTREKVNELLGQVRKSEMPDEIFVSVHHPDELVYSTAAKVIYDENPTRSINILKRLSGKKQQLIEILTTHDDKNLLVERVKLIKRIPIFFSVPENTLVKLVKIFTTYRIKRNEKIEFYNKEENCEDILVILRGMLTVDPDLVKEGEIKLDSFGKNDVVIRGVSVSKQLEYMVAKKDTLILKGNRYRYFNLLVDELDIITPMFQMLRK